MRPKVAKTRQIFAEIRQNRCYKEFAKMLGQNQNN
jgi:hypothetical protein